MTTLAKDRTDLEKPKPPRLGMYIAASLELCMLVIFFMYQSPTGCLVWIAYFWFSALNALIFGGD